VVIALEALEIEGAPAAALTEDSPMFLGPPTAPRARGLIPGPRGYFKCRHELDGGGLR
jgi:hypothetical protein